MKRVAGHARDSADLARFGYKQELKRSLGMFSSFAVAFSYISPSTGIFTLFALGLTTLGGVFIWTWPVVALGQFMSLFVIYGFDTTSTLAEETRDPRRAAPKAVLFSVVGAFIIGGVFLLGTLVAIPNLHKAIAGAPAVPRRSSRLTSPPVSPRCTCWWSPRRSSSAACRSWRRRSGSASGCRATTSCRYPARWRGSRRTCTRRFGPASR